MIRRFALLSGICCCWVSLTGCSQQKDHMSMQPPPRPSELDRLNVWAGKWDGTSEMKMHDGSTQTSRGTSECSWDLDNRVMIERATFEMPGMGTMKSIGIYGYDPSSKKFVSDWHSSMGECGHGTMTYNEKTRTFKMSAKGKGCDGSSTTGKGTIRMVDDNTMEWTWAEYDGMGLMKKMEIKGTSRRTAS